MISLNNPLTGHTVKTDDESADFWRRAGYQDETKKAPAKKSTSRKSSSTKK